MNEASGPQSDAFEQKFSEADRFSFHDTPGPLTRYVRDSRLGYAVASLQRMLHEPLADLSVLVVCGGVGGEASYLKRRGFGAVTNSDFSLNALAHCRNSDPELATVQIDAEGMHIDDESFDVVLVQDGLHHLKRPTLGLNEMVRVARKAVVVIEPHRGMVARAIGTKWESIEGTKNFVFRWDAEYFGQTIRSQLVRNPADVACLRLWDHAGRVHALVQRLPSQVQLPAVRTVYAALRPFRRCGNMFVGIAAK